MSPISKIAVHALNEALCRDTALRREYEGARADEAFDAGEFSAGFHDDAIAARISEITRHVAQRFGVPANSLGIAHLDWDRETFMRAVEAGMAKAGQA